MIAQRINRLKKDQMVACCLEERLAIAGESKDRCVIDNHHGMVSLLVESKITTFIIYEASSRINFIGLFFCF